MPSTELLKQVADFAHKSNNRVLDASLSKKLEDVFIELTEESVTKELGSKNE